MTSTFNSYSQLSLMTSASTGYTAWNDLSSVRQDVYKRQQYLKGLNHSLLYLLQTLTFGQSVRKVLPLPFAVSVKILHPTPDLAFSEIFFQKNRQIQQFCKRPDRFLCSWICLLYTSTVTTSVLTPESVVQPEKVSNVVYEPVGEQPVATVSYTHLDVYKRQV